MDQPGEKETKGVPWGDHNETTSTPPDTRREEYGDADPEQNADERATSGRDVESDQADGAGDSAESGTEGESEQEHQNRLYDL
jgi:hypothetical protein